MSRQKSKTIDSFLDLLRQKSKTIESFLDQKPILSKFLSKVKTKTKTETETETVSISLDLDLCQLGIPPCLLKSQFLCFWKQTNLD
jgi:hypothetical protein